MSISDCIKYWEWSARQYWQYQRRGSWKYEWHGDTLIRYVETAPADPDFAAGLLEWLKMPESVHGFDAPREAGGTGLHYDGMTVYNKPANLTAEWKPVSAWYEQQEGQVDERTKLKLIRVYQALQKCKEDGAGDGPYMVEKGCMYRVTFRYHWKVETLPEVPQGTSGVQWRLEQITRDDETGLWSCCLVKRERVRQDVDEYLREITEYESRTEEQHLGVRAGETAGKAASAGKGVLVKRQIRKNEDCTSDVTNETVTERPVERAAVTVERSLRAKTTTVEDRNMPAKLAEEGLKVGERVRNEETPGGRWNRTKTVTEARPPGKIRETCRKSIFEHGHSKTEVVDGAAAPTPDAPEAADGKVTTETVRKMEDGTAEVETETREEQPVQGAVEEVRKMLRGTRRTTVNRSMAEKAAAANLKIGETVRNERTEGGRWTQTLEKVDPTPVGKIHESCQKTALGHVHSRTENVAEDPGEADAEEVANGTIHRREVRRTEEGTFDVTEATDTAVAATDVTEAGAVHRKETRTEYRNAPEITPPAPGVNVEVNAQVRTNEHDLKDGTVVKVEHEKAVRTARGGTALYDEVETSAINDTEEPSETPAAGKTVTCRANANEHGSAATTKIVRTAKAKHEGKSWTTSDGMWTYAHTVDVYRNWPSVPSVPSGKYQANISLSINEFGLIDAVVTTTERKKRDEDGGGQSYSWQGNVTRRLNYQNKEGKLCERIVTAHVRKRRERAGVYHTPESGENGYGFNSHDDGSFGEIYSNIQVGAERVLS